MGLRVGVVLAVALAVLCSLGVSGAAALQTHLLQSTFKPAEGFAPFGPHGIAVDQASGRVYVSDVGRHAVYRFDAGGSAGSPAKLTGADGVAPVSFGSPRGVAVDDSGGPGEGDVYVADWTAGTVRRFDPGGAETAWGPISALAVPLAGTPQAGGLADVVNDGAIAPNGVAVDATGDVYVTDAENDVVDVFAPDGGFVRQFGFGSLSDPKWVAVAADGSVYVTNDSGLLEFAPGGECVEACSSLDSTGVGGVASNAGHVYVSEQGQVSEFDAEGSWVGRFGEATARPRFNRLSFVEGIAVDSTSGDVYVLDLTPSAFGNAVTVFGPRVTVPGAETEAAAELTPVGATLEGSVEPEGVAATECEFEFGTAGYERSVPCAESPASLGTGSAPVPVHADVDGLDPETLYMFRLSAGNAIGAARFEGSIFSTPSAVAVEVEGPSEDSGRSVRLHARLGDRGVPLTDCAFEYLTTTAFEASGGSFAGAASAPCEPPAPSFPVDDAEHPVSAEATGLVGDTAYRFRLRAASAYGTTAVEGPEFITAQTPPIVATGEADEIAAESARLRGSANPSGLPTTYYFEYGRTIAYESMRPVGEGTAGSGRLPVELAATAVELQPSTTYHYRLVAKNAIGGEAGADTTFVTPPSTPQLPRAYELVSPAAKHGAGVLAGGSFQASSDGEAVSYLRARPDAPMAPRFVAYRSAGGWAERPVDVPEVSPVQVGPTEATVGFSADLRKAVVVSRKQLTADATKGDWTVYLRDLSSGSYEKLASADIGFHGEAAALEQLLAGGTPSFDHVVLRGGATSFLEGAPPGALYDFHAGQLDLASLDLGETPLETDPDSSPYGGSSISTDGHRLVFRAPVEGPVYLRSEGATHALSASRLPESLGTAVAAVPLGGDAELRHVYFFSRQLTEDSVDPSDYYLYRYDTATGQLLALAPAALEGQEAHALQVSADGGSVYFSSPSALTPDADGEHENIYVWRNGTVEHVAALAPSGEGWETPIDAYWSSPSGRYFAFLAGTPARMYRYDADTETLVCASCPPGGGIPSGSAGVPLAVGAHDGPRLVDDRGEVFFDSPDQLAPGDLNDTRDVYEYGDEAGLRLLSSGSEGAVSRLAAVDDDARDVFFTTADQLVRTDDDDAVDLYDARRGGGIPSQNVVQGAVCASCGGSAAATPDQPVPRARHRKKARRRHPTRRGRAAHRRRCHGGKRHRHCRGRGHHRHEKQPR